MLEAMLGGIASGPCLSLNSEVLECDHSCVFVVVIPAGVSFGLLESYSGFGITPSGVRYAGSLRSNPTLVISAAFATELIVNNVSHT